MNEGSFEQVKQEVMPIPGEAKLITVRDQPSLEKANDFFLTIKALRKKIADVFDPLIAKAHATHKEALKQKADAEAPLIEAERYLNGQVTAYTIKQNTLREQEEEMLRQKAIKQEAERRQKEEIERLAQAAALEASGAKEEADALVAEAIEENEKPFEVHVGPVTIPIVKPVGMALKEYWKAEVTDLKALCKAIGDGKCPVLYVEPNMTALNGMARSLKKEMNVPGVKAVSSSSMAATGRK